MVRKRLLIANWKLNHNRATAAIFFQAINSSPLPPISLDLAVAPVAPMLDYVAKFLENRPIYLAAQNVFYENKGAFTGEWSAEHLRELGVRFCIVGHSERRRIFGESDDVVAKKVSACLKAHLDPVVCVGESEDERASGVTEQVIERQVNAVLHDVVSHEAERLVFAYEPIWAIGTGKNATSREAEDVHFLIRRLLIRSIGEGLADQIRILYGGSVTAQNICAFVSMPNVDGALVGGASLQAESFLSMVEKLRGAE